MKNKKNKLTKQEMVEAYIPPHGLSPEEKASADEELRLLRMQRLREMSDQQRLYADLLRLKFQIEDYLNEGKYLEAFSFGKFLQEYLKVLNKKHNVFASEIGLHTTKLSRLLNDKENPNERLTYRLEKHSGNVIPAILWWKLLLRKLEHKILLDKQTRKEEYSKVKNELHFPFDLGERSKTRAIP